MIHIGEKGPKQRGWNTGLCDESRAGQHAIPVVPERLRGGKGCGEPDLRDRTQNKKTPCRFEVRVPARPNWSAS